MNLAIIGGGPAGLSAAIRARETGLEDVWVIERNVSLGGILNQCIHHGFGVHIFKEELTGPEYARRLIDRAAELGVHFALGAMVTELSKEREITYVSPKGRVTAQAGAVILAMGCRERARGALGIPGGRGIGVYTAGTAQALVNMKGILPGKRVVILGSGDIGLIMARRMTLEGAKVLGVFEIMPHSGGLKRNIAQCLNDYDIPLHLSHTVTRTKGVQRLEGVYIAPVDEQLQPSFKEERFIECDTLLLSVGLIPENELARSIGVELSPTTGGATVNNRLETSIEGVFACGNALHVHDLVDYVTQEAYEAAENAVRFIQGRAEGISAPIPVRALHGVRYTVPSSIIPEGPRTPYTLSFRSDGVYSPATVEVLADGKPIRTSVQRRIIVPSEMERIKIVLPEIPKEIGVTIRGVLC
ncbi:MAG: NAD(P)/FAD-dependent oxidoreductase [Defluviitaleaceae bacterium]|nr:NAD(P)/FAD-dependent oxidoreductase [Defluviitaleaceae bacterium]MCL2273703.1 NAD(P)/FAD-dependent oxidoreductase [Defluviitaleaceae bacterium]